MYRTQLIVEQSTGLITVETYLQYEDRRHPDLHIASHVVATRDTHIYQGLLQLGWAPPKTKPDGKT